MGEGGFHSQKTDYFSLWYWPSIGQTHQHVETLFQCTDFRSSFLYNPFCIKILLIKDQTFSLLERKCPVTYNKKNNFLWDLNDRQQSSTGSELNQVTVSKGCQSPQTMPVFICRSSIHVCFSFAYWCSFSFLIYTFADKLRLSSAKYDF